MKRCVHCNELSPKFKCGVNAICPHYYCNEKCAGAQWNTHGKFCKSLILIGVKRGREDNVIQIVGQNNITLDVSREKAIAMSETLAAWNRFSESKSDIYTLDLTFIDVNVLFDLQFFLENEGELRPVPFKRDRFFYIEFCNLLHFLQVHERYYDSLLSKIEVDNYIKPFFDDDAIVMPEEEKQIQKKLWEMCTIEYYTKSLDRLKAPEIDIEKYQSLEEYAPYDQLNPALIVILYHKIPENSKSNFLFSSPYVLYHIVEATRTTPRDVFFVSTLVFLFLPDGFKHKYEQNTHGNYDYFLNENDVLGTLEDVFVRISNQIDDILKFGFKIKSRPEKKNNVRIAQLFMMRTQYRTYDDLLIVPYNQNIEFRTDIKRWVKMFGIEIIGYFVSQDEAWNFILEVERQKK